MRKKRSLQRDKPIELLRDSKLFAIACEGGEREPNYFSLLEDKKTSSRIKLHIIKDEENTNEKYETKSAPKWVLERALKYFEKYGLKDKDELWFVMDIDKWEVSQLKEIHNHCKNKPNWHIILSNPCFEVWLYLHQQTNILNSDQTTCKLLKKQLSELNNNEAYNCEKYMYYFLDAIKNAKKLDKNPTNFFPEKATTKVYQLAEAVMKIVGDTNFKIFLEQFKPKI